MGYDLKDIMFATIERPYQVPFTVVICPKFLVNECLWSFLR